jgi:glycosyltransferase involved in cell wall biosynthesis
MKISLVTMSRDRPKYLIESLESFIVRAQENENIEYIAVIDDDDLETKKNLQEIKNMSKKYNVDIQIFETPRIPLEQYLNTGATVATGDIIFFIADDVFCEKANWDKFMSDACEEYLNEPFLIWTVGSNEDWKKDEFPTHFGISKKWYDIAELVTCHRSSDECIRDLAMEANLRVIKLFDWYLHKQRIHPNVNKKIPVGALEPDKTTEDIAFGYQNQQPSMDRHKTTGDIFDNIVDKLKNWKSDDK